MECPDCNVEMAPTAEEDELECPMCGGVYCLACQDWTDPNRYTSEPVEPEPVEPDCGV